MVPPGEPMARPWVSGGGKGLWGKIQNKPAAQKAAEIQKQPQPETDRRAIET